MMCATAWMLLTAALCSFHPQSVVAWPTGAGKCPKGAPAVGGPHTSTPRILNGTLAEAPQNLQLLVDGVPLTMDNATVVPTGQSVEVQLVGDMAFKGFLIRLGPHHSDDEDAAVMMEQRSATHDHAEMDLTSALGPTTDNDPHVAVDERNCVPDGVAGVTHTMNDEKTQVMATMEIPEGGELMDYMMDVTVVITKTTEVSEYYHSSFILKTIPGDSVGVGGLDGETEEVPMEVSASPAGLLSIAITALMGTVGMVALLS